MRREGEGTERERREEGRGQKEWEGRDGKGRKRERDEKATAPKLKFMTPPLFRLISTWVRVRVCVRVSPIPTA